MYISVSKLCKELLKISLDLVPADPIMKHLLRSLIDSVSEQTKRTDLKLDQLIDAPFKNGLHFLTSADVIINPISRQKHIEDALAQFVDASSKAVAENAKAQSMFYAGVCYTLLSEPIAALHMFEKAYLTGWVYESQTVVSWREPSTTDKVVEAFDSLNFLPFFGMVKDTREAIDSSVSFITRRINKMTGRDKELRDKLLGQEWVLFEKNFFKPLRELLLSKSSNLPLLQEPSPLEQPMSFLIKYA